jgi:hypothetical protein
MDADLVAGVGTRAVARTRATLGAIVGCTTIGASSPPGRISLSAQSEEFLCRLIDAYRRKGEGWAGGP